MELSFYHFLSEASAREPVTPFIKESPMKTSKLVILSILFISLTASAAFAADDGNTKPRLSTGSATYYSGAQDIINQTSVSGNIKGVSCNINSYANGATSVIFTVNGAATQTIDVSNAVFPDGNGDKHTGWIPMNIRFTSSIRVQVQLGGSGGQADCYVSWALD